MQKDEGKSVALTREELYEQVWTTPMARLAREYGMSDRGLAKLCQRFRIPRPGRGYWAKRQHGKRVQQPPLPPLKDFESSPITVHRQPPRELPVLETDGTIVVPEAHSDPHPLIVRTEESLRRARPDQDGLVSPRRRRALRVRAAPANIDRAMRILDALVKALEERGCTVQAAVDEDGSPQTIAIVDEEAIEFRLTEKVKRVERKLTEEDRRREPWKHRVDGDATYEYRPTGALSLEILTWSDAEIRRKWSDLKKRRLEERLDLFVATLRLTSQAIKRRRREEDEARRRREAFEKERSEKRRLIREEEERLQQLDAEVDAWHRSQRIRAYVEAVRETASGEKTQDAKNGELQRWIAWATAQADRLDPLTETPPSIVDEKRRWEYGWGW